MTKVRGFLACATALSLSLAACKGSPKKEAIAEEPSPTRFAAASVNAASASAPGLVPPSELEVVEHTVVSPARGKDDKENYWLQLQIWGEMKNKSNRTVELIRADITYYDAAGKRIGIDSINTAVRKDVGDKSAGEDVSSAVHFVPPGASVPFHYTRNLAAIKGVPASHKITLRAARAVADPPVGVAVGVKESVGDMKNPALENGGVHRMRAFEGTIENRGKTGCRDPKLVVAFLSPDGKIKELASFDARREENYKLVLGPGQSTPFKGAVHAGFDAAWRETAPVKSWVGCEEPY
jgi:hypothetical protein